jgi:hypothetical protein
MDGTSFWSTLPGVLTALAAALTAIATLLGALHTAGIIGKRGRAEKRAEAAVGEATVAPVSSPTTVLRTLPAILAARDLKARLVAQGLFDQGMNAGGRGVTHAYASLVIGRDVVVTDQATGLMWQQDGSEGEMTFADAKAHVARLNQDRLAGFADWRLPTAEELGSLMEPQPRDGLHIDVIFQRGVNFVWAVDRSPDDRVWLAYFYDGRLACEPPGFNAWVRAVRTITGA